MNANELIERNNEKRKQLKEENRKYYEDLLIYIRLSYNKSTQETEEILSELLDHLLEAQAIGKTAKDVFGNDPKRYADEIIGELPKMVTNDRLLLFSMGLLYFLAVSTILSALFRIIGHYIFGVEGLIIQYHLGTLAIITVVSIPVAFLLLYLILKYFVWACFKKINKIVEFFIFWGYGILSVGVFVVLFLFTPDLGPVFDVSMFSVLTLGLVLYGVAHILKGKID